MLCPVDLHSTMFLQIKIVQNIQNVGSEKLLNLNSKIMGKSLLWWLYTSWWTTGRVFIEKKRFSRPKCVNRNADRAMWLRLETARRSSSAIKDNSERLSVKTLMDIGRVSDFLVMTSWFPSNYESFIKLINTVDLGRKANFLHYYWRS